MSAPDPRMVAAYAQALGRPIITKAEYIARLRTALADGQGYAAAKIGRSEKQWLYYPIFLAAETDPLRRFAYAQALAFHFQAQAGLFPAEPEFYLRYNAVYAEYLRRIDCLGLFFDVPALEQQIIRHYQVAAELIHYRDQEPDRSAPANEAACYLPLFAGKRLLLIASCAHFLRQRATPETYARVWAKTGKPWFWPATVDSLEFPYGYDVSTQQTYGDALRLLDVIQRQIAQREFDVALIAAGGLGLPLAGFVKSLGRVGLSLGGHLQVIFGVYGNRWRSRESWQQRYFNEWWVDLPAHYLPTAPVVAEDAAYW